MSFPRLYGFYWQKLHVTVCTALDGTKLWVALSLQSVTDTVVKWVHR